MSTKEESMSKGIKHRREERKKPVLSLKERRAKKQEKKQQKQEHRIDLSLPQPTEQI